MGIEATPRILEFNTLVADTRSGHFDAAITGATIDTSLDLSGNFHSRSIQDGDNFFRYSSPALDRLLDEAAGQKNIADAAPLLHQIEHQLHRDQPVTFLWESQRLAAINRRVHDARPNLQSAFFHLQDWWVSPRP